MVVATLALGIGPATVVFGMVDQLLLRPLPGVANTGSAAYLVFGPPGRHDGLSWLDFDELRRSTTLVDGMASYGRTSLIVTPDQGRPVAVRATTIYGDYFEILGAEPSEGRLLSAGETDLDANPLLAVISEAFRDRMYGVNQDVVGRILLANGQPVEIVGVVAKGFAGAERGDAYTEAWLPHGALVPLSGFPPERMRSRESTMHRDIIVGLHEGVALEAVEDQVGDVMSRIATTVPESVDHLPEAAPRVFEGLHTPPLVRDLTHRTLRMMAWAVALILAISCANVANLLLFRNLARRGALATLRALGASSRRLARQQLAESLVLGVLGGVAGVAVAWVVALPFRGEQLVRMPAFEGFTLGWTMALFVCGASVFTALLCGAAPAALVGRFDLGAALKASRARETGRMGPLRAALSAGQVSLTLALLVGGLLMVRTIANLRAVETGLDIEGVTWAPILARGSAPPDQAHARDRELLTAITSLPGVEAAALDWYGPHGSQFRNQIGLPGAMESEPTLESMTYQWWVTPGWFDLFGMEVLSGRTFEDNDWRVPPGNEVVLTASLARRLFGRIDVAGQAVLVGTRTQTERRVIGVVEDYTSMLRPSAPTDAFFVLMGEVPSLQLSILAKIRPGDGGAVTRVRETIESFFPDVPVAEPLFLTERVEDIRSEEQMLGYLLWTLSAFGVLMSAVGLYGALYFVVSNRQKEFGIRRALGADGLRIVRLVTGSAAVIVGSGAAAGVLVAYPLSRVLRSQLFGVGELDLASYAGAAGLVVLAAFVACLTPARAALRADPVATLREE
jgi:predicted permease